MIKPSISARASLPASNNKIFSEYRLKAVYLYNLLKFVQWPAEKCGVEGIHPQKIVVIGKAPFKNALRELQSTLERTKNKHLTITFVGPYKEGMDLQGCSLLFICESEKKNFSKIIKAVGDQPMLTVADNNDFIQAGGMITLMSQHNKLRWTINRDSTQRSGLRLSAKLLDIAVKIIDNP